MMFDLLITGGRLIDGTGTPWRFADVGIAGDRIAAVGQLKGREARRRIDASGHIVCPGFIDVHSHADLSLIAGRWVDARLLQGVTTEVVGQDGLSYAPVTEPNLPTWRRYLSGLNGDFPQIDWRWRSVADLIERYQNRAANAVYLVPHGAVRVEAMGWDPRPAQEGEIRTMQDLVRQGLEEGAAGLSTGLTYVPCSHATTDEMVALCEPVAAAGGILSIHLRSYGADLPAALAEAIEIGRRSEVAVQVSHLRGTESCEPAYAQRLLEQIEAARSEGIDVTFDVYPYTSGCGPLFSLLPTWAQSGGPRVILEHLADPSARQRMAAEMAARPVDWSIYQVSNAPAASSRGWEGHSLAKGAQAMGISPPAFALHLLRETELNATIVAEGGKPFDNETMLRHPCSIVCSDGILVGGCPHPRGYGTFPRLLSRLVRDKGLLRWEEAIHKITAMPAARLNLQDRGLVRQGAAADLVSLSPERVADGATYQAGRRPPTGIDWVLVNGHVVVENGRYVGGEWGRALTPLSR
jgi:N-acyl-D-amino-acid deacylase